jgi:hypothetical protein
LILVSLVSEGLKTKILGARLAAKLKATIIVNGTEFNHAGEMSVDDRHLYHEALEAVFPPGIAVSATEAPSVTEARKVTQRKMLLVVLLVSFLAGAFISGCTACSAKTLSL